VMTKIVIIKYLNTHLKKQIHITILLHN
jgi:hypothetical protein